MAQRMTIAVLLLMTGMVAALVAGLPQTAKPKPSQHGSDTLQVADTTITIDIKRPVARGRELFGALVPYGRVWCPGADNCTTIEISTDVKMEGQALAKGTYSLWALPEADRWTMIVNKAHPIFHTRYPADQDVLKLQVTPRAGTHMETLAFYFPVVEGRHTELAFHWGTVVVPLAIDVP